MVKNVEKHLSVRLLHPDKSGFAMTGYVLLFVPSAGIRGHPKVSLPRRWRDQPLVDERAKPPPLAGYSTIPHQAVSLRGNAMNEAIPL